MPARDTNRNGFITVRIFCWVLGILVTAIIAYAGTIEVELRHWANVASTQERRMERLDTINDTTEVRYQNLRQDLKRLEDKVDRLLERTFAK